MNTQPTTPASAPNRLARLFTLRLEAGSKSLPVYSAIVAYPKTLYETAAYGLADNRVDSYLDYMEEIETINELVDELVYSMSERVEELGQDDPATTKQFQQEAELKGTRQEVEVLRTLTALKSAQLDSETN